MFLGSETGGNIFKHIFITLRLANHIFTLSRSERPKHTFKNINDKQYKTKLSNFSLFKFTNGRGLSTTFIKSCATCHVVNGKFDMEYLYIIPA